MTIFLGNVVLDDKNEYNFSMGNGVPNNALKFFPQKPSYWLNKTQKTSFDGTFSHVRGSIGPIIVTK